MVDVTTLTARRDEAVAALHALLTGQAATAVGRDGRSVSFSGMDEGKLRAYIADLGRQIAAAQGQTPRARLRPVVFR